MSRGHTLCAGQLHHLSTLGFPSSDTTSTLELDHSSVWGPVFHTVLSRCL